MFASGEFEIIFFMIFGQLNRFNYRGDKFMTYWEKIQEIEKILGDGRFKNRTVLACAVYYKLVMGISFREVPLSGTCYSWSNIRYWYRKLRDTGRFIKIINIVFKGVMTK